MAETSRVIRYSSLAVVFAVGLGLGWAGATHRAIDENRVRDGSGFDAVRSRLDAEEMRVLDLDEQQRQVFVAAREEVSQAVNRLLVRYRPELDLIMQQADEKIRPVLSPRQLAVYDRMEQSRRMQMPVNPDPEDD